MNNDEIAGGPVLQSPHQIDFLNKVDIFPKIQFGHNLILCV